MELNKAKQFKFVLDDADKQIQIIKDAKKYGFAFMKPKTNVDDAEYIERKSAYPLAKRICDAIDSEEFQRLNFGLRILDWIDEVPAVDVRPVVRGKWKKAPCHETDEAYTYICPFCRWYMIAIEPMNFCPNCGADMRERE